MRAVTKSPKAIVVKNLRKTYGQFRALKGVSFTVPKGRILALLGPNGAGKTTVIKILSTLLRADSGRAIVNGCDVAKNAEGVRSSIGLTGQYAAVDGYLTGQENLCLIGRLYGLSGVETRTRAKQLMRQFDLLEVATRPAKTYSGGTRRRLDLAMSLIASPPVLFLDEPTTGLDPRSRLTMWGVIKQLAASGTTILLTTQYMEEADRLSNDIVVIDKGKIIVQGTSRQLKAKVGSDRLELTIAKNSSFALARRIVGGESLSADAGSRTLSVATKDGVATLRRVLQELEKSKISVENVALHRPTLEDVFLSLTGHSPRREGDDA